MSAGGPESPTRSPKRSKRAIDSSTRRISCGLSNWARKAPVEAGVVREQSRARFSSTTQRSPARAAKKAVAAPTIPPPSTTRSAVRGSSPA